MAVIGNVELVAAHGTFFKVPLPVAASQTLQRGEPFKLSSGQVTRVAATTEAIDTGDDMMGWVAEDTFKKVNGTTTSLATNTLVNCILYTRNIVWVMPTYGTAPAITNLLTNYAGYQDVGVYKLNISNTTNPVFTPIYFDLTDGRGALNRVLKSTFAVGDRMGCLAVDSSFKQVLF